MADAVNHPDHYTWSDYETIDVIEGWKLGYHLGNAVKYISRAEHKGNQLEDLKKAEKSLRGVKKAATVGLRMLQELKETTQKRLG